MLASLAAWFISLGSLNIDPYSHTKGSQVFPLCVSPGAVDPQKSSPFGCGLRDPLVPPPATNMMARLWNVGHYRKHGLVLGVSLSVNFAIRAALCRDGTAIDMNTLVPTDSTLFLESACSINDKGEIIGFALLKSNPNESLATPSQIELLQVRAGN